MHRGCFACKRSDHGLETTPAQGGEGGPGSNGTALLGGCTAALWARAAPHSRQALAQTAGARAPHSRQPSMLARDLFTGVLRLGGAPAGRNPCWGALEGLYSTSNGQQPPAATLSCVAWRRLRQSPSRQPPPPSSHDLASSCSCCSAPRLHASSAAPSPRARHSAAAPAAQWGP